MDICPRDLQLTTIDPLQHTVTFSWKPYKVEPKYGVLVGYECNVYYENDTVHTEMLHAYKTSYTVSLQRELNSNLSLPKAISIAAFTDIAITDHTPPVEISQSG